MRSRLVAVRARLAAEDGMSLPEVLISMVIFIVVLGAMLSLFETAAKQAPQDTERALAIRESQAGLANMVRELRQAYRIQDAETNAIEVLVTINGVSKHVRYECDEAPSKPAPAGKTYYSCRRVEAAVGALLPAMATGKVVIDRVVNTDGSVFTYAPDTTRPTYVKARIQVPSQGERGSGPQSVVTLDDGFYLRNVALGG